jgi:hypothetical protein
MKKIVQMFLLPIALGLASTALAKDKSAVQKKADPAKTEEETQAKVEETAPENKEKSPPDIKSSRFAALRATMVVKVANPNKAQDDLKQKATKLGGFPTMIRESLVVFKVPPEKLQEAMEAFASCGLVIKKTIEREDLTHQIAQLKGTLQSKTEIFEKLRSFFDDSDLTSTLEIERSMMELVQEIEDLKGQLRVAHERSMMSVVDVSFLFRERERVVYTSSPFEWLNSANLRDFLKEF